MESNDYLLVIVNAEGNEIEVRGDDKGRVMSDAMMLIMGQDVRSWNLYYMLDGGPDSKDMWVSLSGYRKVDL